MPRDAAALLPGPESRLQSQTVLGIWNGRGTLAIILWTFLGVGQVVLQVVSGTLFDGVSAGDV